MLNQERLRRDVVVIGASAGGVSALSSLLAEMPAGFAGTIAIVLHLSPINKSLLPPILARSTALQVLEAEDGTVMKPGTVYVAPPDLHMRIDAERRLALGRDPRQHRTRPAIDPLFVSAARAAGRSVAGVLLSGNGGDGVAGLIAIKAHGGLSLVQAPEEAAFPFMPTAALRNDRVDGSYAARTLGQALVALAEGEVFPDMRSKP